MSTWLDFWNGSHSIYVNNRHKAAHSSQVLADFLRWVPGSDSTVLDFGCGEALYADELAKHCRSLYLSDGAALVRSDLQDRFADRENIRVLSVEDCDGIAPESLDLVVVNSVLQYLSEDQLDGFLSTAHRTLKSGETLVIADVISPDVGPLTDAVELLRFGWKEGFAIAAIAGLVRTVLSDYRKLREDLGFAMYRPEEMLSILQRHGFTGEVSAPNFGHNQARNTFAATKNVTRPGQ